MSEQVNPYHAPDATEQMPEALDHLPLAGRGRRFLTMVIDYFALASIVTIVITIDKLLDGIIGRSIDSLPELFFIIAVPTTYYVFFEGIWGKTPGKFVLGTMVLACTGERPSLNAVIIRSLSRCIPLESLSFLGEEGWHDMISDTKVVLTRARNPA